METEYILLIVLWVAIVVSLVVLFAIEYKNWQAYLHAHDTEDTIDFNQAMINLNLKEHGFVRGHVQYTYTEKDDYDEIVNGMRFRATKIID